MWWRGRLGGENWRQQGNVRLLVTLLAIDAAVLSWALTSESAIVYSRSVAEVLERPEVWEACPALRVEGRLVPGTLRRARDSCEFRFSIDSAHASGRSRALRVKYRQQAMDVLECAKSGLLCDVPGYDLSVAVEGRLERDARGFYVAGTRVMTKCPAKYELAEAIKEQIREHGEPCPPIPIEP